MTVSAVTVPDSASDPKHPDHDRWVKERTLKMEVDHARAVGLPLHVAEAENIRLLERAEQIAKATPIQPTRTKQDRTPKQVDGVTKRAAKREAPKAKQCSCGFCMGCKRGRRIMLIMQMGRQDPALSVLAKKLMIASLQASSGTGTFVGLSKRDRDRALHTYVDAACDASVRTLGAWR